MFAVVLEWSALWMCASLFVWATASYWRSSHTTGYETMETLRRLRVWPWLMPMVRHHVVDAGGVVVDDSKSLYVVLPNATNTVLLWGFGLHGGQIKTNPCYLMPEVLFWIPLVRELLLLTGAVSAGRGSPEQVIERMTFMGKSVAYAPSGMRDALLVQEERNIHAQRPGLSLFTLACHRGLAVVPCLCLGENDRRYIFFTSERLRRIQRWFLERLGYPFPLLCCPDTKGARIDLWIGAPISSKGKNAEELQRDFFTALQALNNTGVDEKELILKD
jgi:hypothetical protein